MVVLGDSIAYGMCAQAAENEWVQVVAGLIRRFQDEELRVLNRGLPAGVISPRCPGYEESTKPSLVERYRRHCIALEPDLVIVAEGLNDMRSGMPLQSFIQELDSIVAEIQQETGALVVLVGIYHQVYGCGANDPLEMPLWTRWDYDTAKLFNIAIRQVALRHGALFADAQAAMGNADWLLNPDCCHLNDLGHTLVGHAVFQTIATHCRGLATRTLSAIEELDVSIANTGGTDTDDEIQNLWAQAATRFGVEL
jgi:lysophospholipase L1-like esterase